MKKLLNLTAVSLLIAGMTGCSCCPQMGSWNPFRHERQVARPIICAPQMAAPCAPACQPCAPACSPCDPCAGGAPIMRSSSFGGEIIPAPAGGEVRFEAAPN